MADIAGAVIGAVACVAQCLSPQGEHRINRWRAFKGNFKILNTEVKKLKAERTRLQRRVNLAKKNGDGIEEHVQNWLERAEEIEVEIQKWLERASKITGDDQEAGEIGGDAHIEVAAAAREIGEGEETVAAGELRAGEETTKRLVLQQAGKVQNNDRSK